MVDGTVPILHQSTASPPHTCYMPSIVAGWQLNTDTLPVSHQQACMYVPSYQARTHSGSFLDAAVYFGGDTSRHGSAAILADGPAGGSGRDGIALFGRTGLAGTDN